MARELKANLMDQKIINVLQKFMIFDDLSREEIKQVLCLDVTLKKGYQDRIAKLCQYNCGETVIQEGVFDCWSFWVVKGVFDVIQEGEIISSFSRPGEIFGEMSVLEGIPRTASVVCTSGGVCLCIDMSVLETMENDRVREMIRKGVYKVILMRLARTKEKIMVENHRLEMKYARLLRFEKKIREKSGNPK